MTWKAITKIVGHSEFHVHLINESRRPLPVMVAPGTRVALEKSPLRGDIDGTVTVTLLGDKHFANPGETITLSIVTETPLKDFPASAELFVGLYLPEGTTFTVRHRVL